MKIIKRNGQEAIFDEVKITNAIIGANKEVVETERLSEEEIDNITNDIKYKCQKMKRALSVEEIQNLVEDELMKLNAFSVARKYITYRFQRALARQSNTTDEQILSLIECANEEVKQEEKIDNDEEEILNIPTLSITKQEKNIDDVISKIQKVVEEVKELGFEAKLEEYDFEGLYQFVIKVDNEN